MKIEALSKAAYRQFGFTMAIAIVLLFGLFMPWVFKLDIAIWPWVLSGVLFSWAFIVPTTLSIIYKPWMLFGYYISTINTKIILVVVFFVVFLPVALLLKHLGKDAMNRKFKDKSTCSYWKKSYKQEKNHMEKVY